jgi:hypothetical protein
MCIFQNPMMSVPGSQTVARALAKLETLVVIDTMLSETAMLADYVLPGTTYLERYDLNSHWVTWPVLGLSVGKWVHNTGGIFMITIFGAVLVLPVIGLLTGTLAEYHPFRTHLPELSLYNLNILGKMGFGALGGFEYMAILAGETRAPARSVTSAGKSPSTAGSRDASSTESHPSSDAWV